MNARECRYPHGLPQGRFLHQCSYFLSGIFSNNDTEISKTSSYCEIVRSLFLSKRGLLPLCLISELEKNYENPSVEPDHSSLNFTIEKLKHSLKILDTVSRKYLTYLSLIDFPC